MTSETAPNLSEVIEQIRERARARQASVPRQPAFSLPAAPRPSSAMPAYDLYELHANLAECNALHNSVGTLNPRRPGLHNQAIQFVKKIMRRSLTWYTRPLHEFQGAVTRTLNETTRALEDIRTSMGTLEARLAALGNLETRIASLEQTASTSATSMQALQRDLRRVKDELRESEPRLEQTSGTTSRPYLSVSLPKQGPELEFDYFMFEERFRGSEHEIKNRQSKYLEYFRGCTDVLDLGCGRGEFLELLRENDIPARGVESGKDALLLCREKGLAVTEDDLLTYLQSLPDQSLGGIFSSQVIEHLAPAAQMRLIRLSQVKLRPGAPLVIETINPECVYALCRNFYLDPTHVRPVHPEMLLFVADSMGFSNLQVKYSSAVVSEPPKLSISEPNPELEQFNLQLAEIHRLLFGFQDYAVIGWR